MATVGKFILAGLVTVLVLVGAVHLYVDHLSFHAMQDSQVALSRLIVKLHAMHPELFDK